MWNFYLVKNFVKEILTFIAPEQKFSKGHRNKRNEKEIIALSFKPPAHIQRFSELVCERQPSTCVLVQIRFQFRRRLYNHANSEIHWHGQHP